MFYHQISHVPVEGHIYMVGCCAEVVVGRMQLEGCAIEGYGFQGADLALVITYHVVIR